VAWVAHLQFYSFRLKVEHDDRFETRGVAIARSSLRRWPGVHSRKGGTNPLSDKTKPMVQGDPDTVFRTDGGSWSMNGALAARGKD